MQIELDRGKSCIAHGYTAESLWFIQYSDTGFCSAYVSMSASQYQQELTFAGSASVESFYSRVSVHAIVPHLRGITYTQVVWCSVLYPVPYLRTMSRGRVVKTLHNLEWLTTTHAGQLWQRKMVIDCRDLAAYLVSRRSLYAD